MPNKHFRADKPVRRARAEKGYVLHDRRLAFSARRNFDNNPDNRNYKAGDVKAKRTIKFPLAQIYSSLPINKLADAIRHDSLGLYGPLNFSDWAEYMAAEKAQRRYSFLDFWLDALALGGVFQQSTGDLDALVKKINREDVAKNFLEKINCYLNPDLKDGLSERGLYDFITKDQRKVGDVSGKIRQAFKNDWLRNQQKEPIINRLGTEFKGVLGQEDTSPEGIKKLLLFIDPKFHEKAKVAYLDAIKPKGADLTFIFVPELKPLELESNEALIRGSRIEGVLSSLRKLVERLNHNNDEKKTNIKVESLLGIDSNGNAFSNFGGRFFSSLIKDNGTEVVLDLMNKKFQYQGDQISDVKTRIENLRRRAQGLALKPRLTSNWGDFRSELVGKLSSWFSNRDKYEKNIESGLKILDESVKKRLNEVRSSSGNRNNGVVETRLIETEELIGRLNKVQIEDGILSSKSKLVYDELKDSVAALNSVWNEWQGENHIQDQENSPASPAKARRKRAESNDQNPEDNALTLPKYPSFFGDERRLTYAKVWEAPYLLTRVNDALERCLKSLEPKAVLNLEQTDQEKIFSRLLAQFRELSRLNSETAKSFVNDNRLEPLRRIHPKSVYYINKYARLKSRKADLPTEECRAGIVSAFKEFSENTLAKTSKIDTLPVASMDSSTIIAYRVIQTLVSVLARSEAGTKSILEEGEKLSEIKTCKTALPAFPKIKSLFTEYQNPKSEKAAARIGSEAAGILALISKSSLVERYNIQSINGDQTNIYTSGHADPQQKRFAVGLPKWTSERSLNEGGDAANDYPILFLKGNKVTKVIGNRDRFSGPLYAIRSSKYQIQFLRWALQRPKRKQANVKPLGSFLMCEQDVGFNYQPGHLSAAVTGEPRCFAAVPFDVSVKREETKQTAEIRQNIAIGVDVGEYGLAYCVVESKENGSDGKLALEAREAGVFRSGTHRALRDKVARLKRRQKRGVFLGQNSSIAGARESLIGTYMNQLHSILLKWKGKLVFEYNISVFEAGGNRIKTIYDTIKRSDSYTSNKAQNDRQKHIWGIEIPGTGGEVGAAFTSQTCACCRRLYLDSIERSLNVENGYNSIMQAIAKATIITTDAGHYLAHEAQIGNERLRFFVHQDKRESLVKVMDQDLNALKSWIKDYIRPPLWRIGSKVLPKNAKKRRGNSAVFRCAYADCGFVTDADVQASFNVAARYFLRENGKIERYGVAEKNKSQSVSKRSKSVAGENRSDENGSAPKVGSQKASRWTVIYSQSAYTNPPGLERRFFGGGVRAANTDKLASHHSQQTRISDR